MKQLLLDLAAGVILALVVDAIVLGSTFHSTFVYQGF